MTAQTPEGRVKAKIKKYLVEQGLWYFCPATGGFGRSGVPDFIVCFRGRLIGIEAKRPGAKPTDLQTREIAAINAAGGHAFVYDGVSSLANMFESIDMLATMEAIEVAVRDIVASEEPEAP